MTGLEIIKSLGTTAGEIADIISQPCPPVIPETCDRLSCRALPGMLADVADGRAARRERAVR